MANIRKNIVAVAGLLGVWAGLAPAGGAAEYPVRTIRIVVPFPAGGNADVLARIMAQKMAASWKQNVIVDNRAGAAGIIGAEAVAKSVPDGYTLLMGTTGTQTTNPAVYSKLPYDSLKDFAPVSNFAESPFMLVTHPSLPVRTVKDLVALAKSRPGQLHYASFGAGSSAHLVGEMLRTAARIEIVHVPYKGGPPALADLIGGHVEMMFNLLPAVVPQIKSGRLRGLAVAAPKRAPTAPAVATFAEAGFSDIEAGSWYGVLAPGRTPREIVASLSAEISRIVSLPDVRRRLAIEGADPIGNTPEQFAKQIRRDLARWSDIARKANVRVN
jgi:tripartite-type tricarboxylate transporter receptor subunit TctC